MAKESRDEPEQKRSELHADAPDHAVVCARCDHVVTTSRDAIAVDGKHTHDFVNPSGIAFVVRCFKQANGSVGIGEPSTFFSWFRGFAWRIALCTACGVHLGWSFESDASTFHGLVADRIRD